MKLKLIATAFLIMILSLGMSSKAGADPCRRCYYGHYYGHGYYYGHCYGSYYYHHHCCKDKDKADAKDEVAGKEGEAKDDDAKSTCHHDKCCGYDHYYPHYWGYYGYRWGWGWRGYHRYHSWWW